MKNLTGKLHSCVSLFVGYMDAYVDFAMNLECITYSLRLRYLRWVKAVNFTVKAFSNEIIKAEISVDTEIL